MFVAYVRTWKVGPCIRKQEVNIEQCSDVLLPDIHAVKRDLLCNAQCSLQVQFKSKDFQGVGQPRDSARQSSYFTVNHILSFQTCSRVWFTYSERQPTLEVLEEQPDVRFHSAVIREAPGLNLCWTPTVLFDDFRRFLSSSRQIQGQ